MRRGVVQAMSLVTLAVVGLSLRSGVQPAARPISEPTRPPGRTSPSSAPPVKHPPRTSSGPATSPPLPARSPAASAVGIPGDLVDTEYGPVRVLITVSKERITAARAIRRPQGDGTTEQINSYAVPVLNREAVAVQGARIDTVSGATFTSDGYRQWLQSALDAAHRAGAL